MSKVTVLVFLLLPFCWLLTNRKDSERRHFTTSSPLQKSLKDGEVVFKKYCISCHQADGGGVPHMTPPLIQTKYVLGEKEDLIKIVLNGLKNVQIQDETYTNPMPALNILKDQQIAAVLTYIRNSFGNKASAVSIEEVKNVRSDLKTVKK